MYTFSNLEQLDINREKLLQCQSGIRAALEGYDNSNEYFLEKEINTNNQELKIAMEDNINIVDRINGAITDKLSDWTVGSDSKMAGKAIGVFSSDAINKRKSAMSDLSSNIKKIDPNKTYKFKLSAKHKANGTSFNALKYLVEANAKMAIDLANGLTASDKIIDAMMDLIKKFKADSSYRKEDFYGEVDEIYANSLKIIKSVFPVEKDLNDKDTQHKLKYDILPKPAMVTASLGNHYYKINMTTSETGGDNIDIEINGKELKLIADMVFKETVDKAISKIEGKMKDIERFFHKQASDYMGISIFRKVKLGTFYFQLIGMGIHLSSGMVIPLMRAWQTETSIIEAINKAID